MKIIGLTGGIASGKSTVADMLIQAGCIVVDCDKIAWQLAEPGQAIWQIYVDRYGAKVLNQDRTLNRQAVADIVFRDRQELDIINSLVHPLIKDRLLAEAEVARLRGAKVIFWDVPLLFETGFDKMTDEKWLVYVSPATQKARLINRNGYTEDEALRRINSQMSLAEKQKLADVVINNDGDIEALRRQVLEKVNNGQR